MKIKAQMIEKDKFAKNVHSKIVITKKKERERERKKEKQSLVTRKWVAK